MRLGYAKGNTLSMDQQGQAEMIREMILDNESEDNDNDGDADATVMNITSPDIENNLILRLGYDTLTSTVSIC